jgi:hypothetical protein
MSARQAAGAAMATASSISQTLGSVNVTSKDVANNTLPLPLRALRFTVRTEKLLFRKVPILLLRLSGLQTLVHVLSDALGMPAPLAGAGGATAAAAPAGPQSWTAALMEAFELGNIRSLGGMFNFLFSRWAFACLAMVWQIYTLRSSSVGQRLMATRH